MTASTLSLRANGVDFACRVLGDEDAPVVLCIHGFPDTAETWMHDIAPGLAEAGYRVVAPNLRGYAPTSPAPDGRYGILELGQDVVSLIEALGAEPAIVIGHDWGAAATYAAQGIAPDAIRCAITLDIPHLARLKLRPSGLWAMRHFVEIQVRPRAIRWLRDGDGLETLYRRWSPAWDVTEDDLADVRATLSDTEAVRRALSYYWQWPADQIGERGRRLRALLRPKLAAPAMIIVGTRGPAPLDAFADMHRHYTGPFELVEIPDAGHFAHRERPVAVLDAMRRFLDEHAPVTTPE